MNFQFRILDPTLVYLILAGASALLHSTMFTVYTVYYVKAVGLNPLQLVLVGTTLEATALLFEVPTGVVADVYSRRLSVILGVFLLGTAFMLVGAIPLFAVLLLGQVVSGVGYTFMSGATEAWLADEVGEADVGQVLVRAGQVERVAGLIGIAISVGLASIQLNLPYLIGGAGYILLGLFLVVMMPEHGFKPAPRKSHNPLPAMLGVFRDGAQVVRQSPVLLTLLGISFFVGTASEGFDRLGDAHLLANFTFPRLDGLDPVVWFGILGVTTSVLSLVIIEMWRKRLEDVTRNLSATARVLMLLNTLWVVGVVAFGLTRSFPLAFVALAVKAVAGSMAGPLYSTWLIQNINPKVRATVISMSSQANACGQIVGGPGVGLIGNLSLRAAIVTAGLLLAPNTLLYARALKRTDKLENTDFADEAPTIEIVG